MTHWHIITCMSGKEMQAECALEAMGYPGGWHPVEKVALSSRIYQRRLDAWNGLPQSARGPKPEKHKRQPVVTGYVFVPCENIAVEKIKHNGSWKGLDVLTVGDVPYRMSDAAMAQMKHVPERIKELLTEIERQQAEEAEAKRPRVGDRAKVIGGIFEDFEADVLKVSEEMVTLKGSGALGEINVSQEMVERVG